MSRIAFDNYGKRAENLKDTLQVAGRMPAQRSAERLIVSDIIEKLQISPDDNCLDIGCNVGNILLPLSFMVKSMVGIDNESCTNRLKNRFDGDNITLIHGDFLVLDFNGKEFNKIIIYSVLHYLGQAEVDPFIKKAVSLLAPGGCMLLGDIPNLSLKMRFLESECGKLFQKKWDLLCQETECDMVVCEYPQDPDIAEFDDECILLILRTLREMGLNAYILPQNPRLPFGNTREDILVIRPE
jgi:SAM-dependent methyltransferase